MTGCLTCFPGQLHECVHAFLAVAALRRHRGDVVPAHGLDDVHHGLSLEAVRGNHAGEEVIAPVVAQLGRCGGVADLRDLRGGAETDGAGLEEGGAFVHTDVKKKTTDKKTKKKNVEDGTGSVVTLKVR